MSSRDEFRYGSNPHYQAYDKNTSDQIRAEVAKEYKRSELLKKKYEELRKKLKDAGYKRELSSFTPGDIYYIITNTADPENINKGTLKAVRTMCRDLDGYDRCSLEETMKGREETKYNYNIKNNEIWKKGIFASIRGKPSVEGLSVAYNISEDMGNKGGRKGRKGKKSRKSMKCIKGRKSRRRTRR